MRYQNLKAFYEHLAGSKEIGLCHCYLLSIPDDYERKKVIKEVLSYLPASEEATFLSGGETALSHIAEALSMSLFGGEPIVVIDELEKMRKQELEWLGSQLASSDEYLLLGARTKLAFARTVEKKGVVIDLTEEKSWERERRLVEQMQERAAHAQKRLASDAVPLLLERLGMESALIDREIDKLICFVGERPTIERSDIFRIVSVTRSLSLWQAAEVIVWEGGFPSLDEAMLPALPYALRSQLQLGLKIASLMRTQASKEAWSSIKLWPKLLEKRCAQVAKRGETYFREGLERLFRMEQQLRSGASLFPLLDHFRCSLYAKR